MQYTTRLRREAGISRNYWYVQDITQSLRYGQWVKDDTGRLLKFEHKAQALAWIAEQHGTYVSSK
jgi:hypothetical protein